MTRNKILLICPYSHPSPCGIWVRVYSDAKALRDSGYEVHIFSSNRIKGTNGISSNYEKFEGIHIHRFKVSFRLGGTSMFWFFIRKFRRINPDIVHVHGFRHPHSLQGFLLSKISKKLVFMTSHGPFEKDPNRSIILKIIDFLYDKLIAWWELRVYKSVIIISKWEEKYLRNFGVKRLVLIPNGIDSRFIDTPINWSAEAKNQVLYMGRVDPIKRPEWLEYSAQRLPEVNFKIRGPVQGYDRFETSLKNLKIINKKYITEEFINELENTDIFVLPSIRESFGLVLVEAMARGKIVISSNTRGGNDIIENGENGFIVYDENELVEAIEYSYNNWEKLENIRQNARESTKQYDERVTTKKLVELYSTVD